MPSEQELLAELKSLESKAAAVGIQDALVGSVKKAFEQFDTDNSGFIDTKELAYLTKTLGFVMDSEELKEAFKAMDTSNDGKISFDEFFNWWTLPTRGEKSKSIGVQAELRAKLEAQFLLPKAAELCRQLSESKEKGTSTFTASMRVGEIPEGKNHTKMKFEVMGIDKPTDLVNDHIEDKIGAFMEVDFVLNEGVEGEGAVERVKELCVKILALLENMRVRSMQVLKVCDVKKEGNILKLTFGIKHSNPEKDPTRLVDWKASIQEMASSMTMGFDINDLLTGKNLDDKKIQDLVSLKCAGKTVFTKALFTTLMAVDNSKFFEPAVALSSLENVNLEYSFGKAEVLTKVIDVMSGGLNRGFEPVKMLLRSLDTPALVISGQVKQAMAMASMVVPEWAQSHITEFKTLFKSISAFRSFTSGGFQAQLTFENFIDFSILPDFGGPDDPDAPC